MIIKICALLNNYSVCISWLKSTYQLFEFVNLYKQWDHPLNKTNLASNDSDFWDSGLCISIH